MLHRQGVEVCIDNTVVTFLELLRFSRSSFITIIVPVTPSKLVTPTFSSFPDKFDVTPKVKNEESFNNSSIKDDEK